MILLFSACESASPLERVSDALAADAAADAAPAVGLLVSTAALVAEPCAMESVEGYLWRGEGARALGVTTAEVSVDESNGEKTWDFGAVSLDTGSDDDGESAVTGDLTITLDNARTSASVAFTGDVAFTADLTVTACRADADDTYAGRVLVQGEGHYTVDGDTAVASIDGDPPDKALEWAPSNAPLPASGWVEWTSADEQTSYALESAEYIDPDSRAWPGVATGRAGWQGDAALTLP
ncbi:MAG: hypothetical protein FJ102_11635 [Deltaproteobacteria bacterium]|nr:hypothetical protein [Deltaproteobacteria bacterium]